MPGVITPGPDYWLNTFGISTFAEFQAATNGLLDLGLPHVPWIDTPLQRDAYDFPTSAVGAYLTAGLTSKGFHESSPSGPATVTSGSLIPLLNNSYQELSVGQLIVPNCFQVSVQMRSGGRDIFNVLGVQNAGGTAAAAAAAVKTAWEITNGPLWVLSSLVAMVNYHAVDIGSSGGAIVDLASTTAGNVTTTNSLATRGACALVRWNGATRNRSSRGRMYLGPIMEQNINPDGATITTGSTTTFTAAITAFRNSLASSGYPLVVLSRKLSTAYPVTASALESTIGTQRRRIRS